MKTPLPFCPQQTESEQTTSDSFIFAVSPFAQETFTHRLAIVQSISQGDQHSDLT